MAKAFSSWVHGQAAAAEGQALEFTTWGPGAVFRIAPGRDLWVHIAIPTPVIVEDKRASLHAVHYLFATSDRTSLLANVHIRDGDTVISQQDFPEGQERYGKHNLGLDAENGTQIDRAGFQWGVGLSLRFVNQAGAGQFWLTAAGADFYHDV